MSHIRAFLILTLMSRAAAAAEGPNSMTFLPVSEMGAHAKQVQGENGLPAIEVAGVEQASTVTLIVADHPNVVYQYLVRGRVKYSDVKAGSYLELLNDYGPTGCFFSRGLDDSGPMRSLKGSSEWRDFELPFYAEPGMKPNRLTLNVVLTGSGTVTVSQPVVELIPWSNEWWNMRQGNFFGAIAGTMLGIVGALIGTLMTWMKTRPLAKYLISAVFAICLCCLLAGIAAVCLQQPYHVYFPLLLIGFIGTTVPIANLWNMLKTLQEDELRKMRAIDVA